jgi:hypothetical protein
MRSARPKTLLLTLPLALVATQLHAGNNDHYCDETATNNPPFPCWLVGNFKGKCPTAADTSKWDCVSAIGWVPSPSNPGDNGGGYHLNRQDASAPGAVYGEMPALSADGRGRNALLTIRTRDIGATAPLTLLSLLQPGKTASITELRVQRGLDTTAAELVVVRVDGSTDAPVVLARLPLVDGIDHVQLNWSIDTVDGPILGIATRNTRLRLPLPALDGTTRLDIAPSTVATVIVDLEAQNGAAKPADR